MNQINIDVIKVCLDMMETFGNEKSKASIGEARLHLGRWLKRGHQNHQNTLTMTCATSSVGLGADKYHGQEY